MNKQTVEDIARYTDVVVLYHANCIDGFTAAWCAWRKYPKWTYVPVKYNKPVPVDVKDKWVFLLDFSYSEDDMIAMALDARGVTVLDHHKTAQENLSDLFKRGIIDGIFDMTHCGARLAWNYFNPHETAPVLLDYIEDYDLWTHKLTHSHAIHSAISSYDYGFATWDFLMNVSAAKLSSAGYAILRYTRKCIGEMLPNKHRIYLGSTIVWVPALNVPYMWASLTGEMLAQAEDNDSGIGATWFADADGNRNVSLRSRGDVDVSAIAKRYGGGGHAGAAGFMIPRANIVQFFGRVT